MTRAAKGVMKYGKDGMKALAKAGKDGKDLDKVRDKYNKYDESKGSKPDFLDLDKDGNKKEPMKKAAKDAKKNVKENFEYQDDIENKGEYDQEGDMAKDDLSTIEDAARELDSILQSDDNLPEWVQSKINKAMDYLDTARDYMKANQDDDNSSKIAARC